MAETATSVLQLVDSATRLVDRLGNFLNNTGEAPENLRETKFQLPLLISTLQQIRVDIEQGVYTDSTSSALQKLFDACMADVSRVEDLLAQVTPHADTKWKRMRRAISGLKYDKEIRSIGSRFSRYIQSLLLLQTAVSGNTLREIKTTERALLPPVLSSE
ncbi:uncharacterized protein BJX67DRAFT_310801 [Aspergillus lucknowensis]|uniref:NACHT-NTPase and P-loop NTPases N-terminal domain-containing protein n=1 Tax=Aspergillus lucknowensis TaxID=176173 RepID=A0ABR4LFR7_9EURO